MLKVYKCSVCGNFVLLADDKGGPLACCGKPMKELVANTVDAAKEKHVPVVKQEGNVVEVFVGEVEHPMTEAHYIGLIVLETNKNLLMKHLNYTDKPYAKFNLLDDEEVIAAYECCNLHGFWKK